MRAVRAFFLIWVIISMASCSTLKREAGKDPVTDGLVGGLAGATAGGLTGAVIANGDVAASALLGAGIGVPAGILMGMAYQWYFVERVYERNKDVLEENEMTLARNRAIIEEYRKELMAEADNFQPDPEKKEYLYSGPSLGWGR